MTRSFILAAGILAAAASEASAEAMIRASCSQEGRIIYREEFPASEPAGKRVLIAARHPGAMCVFLDVSGTGETSSQEATPASAVEGIDDAGLAAALSVISSGEPGKAYPDSFAKAMSSTAEKQDDMPARSIEGGFLNLTVGIYKGLPMKDVLAHWKEMQRGTAVLSRMTPTIDTVEGVTVVSIEGVQDSLAAELCEEAGAKGSGCIAAY